MSNPDTLDAAPQPYDGPEPVTVEVAPEPSPLPRAPVQSLLEVVLCSGFPTQLLIGGLLLLLGLRITPGAALPYHFIVAVSLIDTVVLVGLVILFLRARGEDPRAVLLGHVPVWPEVRRGVLYLPLVFALVIALGGLIRTLMPWLHDVPENPLQMMLTSPMRVVTFALVVVLAGGVREEVQRAFILHRFDQDLGGVVLGLVLFSVAFGAGHFGQGSDAAVITGVLGLLWGIITLARRSLIASAVSHALFNLVQVGLYQYASRHGLLPPT
ncbi:CPBP family intramembrane glutamic endopeptidase [Luteitalea sp. TBR-22]|uniref:CPBP family intramembrane glutamic endopeptidase n=1 Tax=Luteitalea sp. TBR-22 TaxID=2802971 RepID=UPI001EF41B7F|nr:type II CAAX endopeptidase family protein [Luteitalea sp. TBR-22]